MARVLVRYVCNSRYSQNKVAEMRPCFTKLNIVNQLYMKKKTYTYEPTLKLRSILPYALITLYLLICSLPSKSLAVQDSFEIRGSTAFKNIDVIYLSYYSSILKKRIDDSSKVIDGYFSFKGIAGDPAVAFLKYSRDRVIDHQMTIMFIEPTKMEIKLTNPPFEVTMISGSKTHFEYDSLYRSKKSLFAKYRQIIEDIEKGSGDKDELEKKLIPYNEGVKQFDLDFFAAHPHSFATGYLLQFYYRKLPAEELRKYYYNMNNKLRESIYGERLKELIPKIKLNLAGEVAPDFTAVSYTKELISLSKFQGRYILLDFWADWCVPCRKNFPSLIKLYNRYHEKGLEIIGVADNDFKQVAWQKAIKDDKVEIWHHVLRGLQKNETDEIDKTKSISDQYNVTLLPTKILIDQAGLIIGRYQGEKGDQDLETKLIEIFK